jgi:hypothetical protein
MKTQDLMDIVQEILTERQRAEDQWGTGFDDLNTLNDWVAYITEYVSSSAKFGMTIAESRAQLIKTGGLIFAALMALERNGQWAPRHYDSSSATEGQE